jgi:hypothetical protein
MPVSAERALRPNDGRIRRTPIPMMDGPPQLNSPQAECD